MNTTKYIKKYHPRLRRTINIVIRPETIKLLLNGKYTCTAFWGGEQVTDPELLDEICRQILNK